MIDDIIIKLLALPSIPFAPPAKIEFIERTNRIKSEVDVPLALKSFREDMLREPKTHISREMHHAEAYCAFWRDMNQEMEHFLSVLHYTWHITHDKPMGADNMLPVIIAILPKDLPTLLRLQQTLEFACEVDRSHYFLMTFYIATTYLIEQFDQEIEIANTNQSAADIKEAAEIADVLQQLRDNDFYAKTYLYLKLKKIFSLRMNDTCQIIYQELALHNIHNYDFDEERLNADEKTQAINDNILSMFTLKNEEPISTHPELHANICKYIAYNEFLRTLCEDKNDILKKLCQFACQFPCFAKELGNDVDDVLISLTDSMRTYLEIPDVKKPVSLLNLFWAPLVENNISFKRFIEFFSKKMRELEMIQEAKMETSSSTLSAMNV